MTPENLCYLFVKQGRVAFVVTCPPSGGFSLIRLSAWIDRAEGEKFETREAVAERIVSLVTGPFAQFI